MDMINLSIGFIIAVIKNNKKFRKIYKAKSLMETVESTVRLLMVGDKI